MAKETPAQQKTVERVMHEYKHGELKIRGTGPKVKSRKQAVAIALHEAGASNQESPKTNRQNLKKTKSKERRGETAQAVAEGKGHRRSGSNAARASGDTRAALYDQAKKKDIPGRSKMSKAQLARALGK